MKRDVSAALLVLVGSSMVRIALDDTYLRYVKAATRPWLVLSGGVLIALGILALVDAWRFVAAGAPDDHDDDGHAHGSPRVAWLLLLPVVGLLVVAPPALGAFTAERQTAVTVAPAVDAVVPPLPAGDPVPIALNDFASRAVWDDGRSLVGREVELTGFVSSAPDGGWYLTRLTLTCCAADAIATKIDVLGATSRPARNAWVTVEGQWVPGGGTQSETAIPHLQARLVRAVPEPSNPYE